MRAATSLGDISSVISALPTLSGSTRLAVFYSPAAIINAQLSVASRHICVLEAENTTLKDSVRSLSKDNTAMHTEAEALRTQAYNLALKNVQLEKEKETLIKELRAERVQGIARTRKVYELESAIKQRDAFVHAMIDISLHQHVLKNAYFSVETGCSVDEAIVSAILAAASNPASPWSRILSPPDVTKSDLYKCAIELAAAARLRTDKSARAARFWRHVAKCDPKNADILTPSSSRLEGMDQDLKNEERGNMLDGLLDRLRAGEDIRTQKVEERKPMLSKPDISDCHIKSPASVFFEFYRSKTRAPVRSDLSFATLSSWNSYSTAPLASSKLQDNLMICRIARLSSNPPSSSLERIRGVFSASSVASSLDHSSIIGTSQDTLSSVDKPFQPATTFVTGRGRSATVPFSARDLTLPVKNVISRLPIVTAPGDKEQQAQALAGQRVRFNKQMPLVRSKAIKATRPRTLGADHTISSSVRIKTGLPTPPAEVGSIRYVRPPTVTRKKETDPPYFDASPTTFHSNHSNKPILASVPSSPSQQSIKPYVAKGSNPRYPGFDSVTSLPCQTPSMTSSSNSSPAPQKWTPRNLVKRQDTASTPESDKNPTTIPPKQRPSIPIVSTHHSSSSNKENIPPQTRSSIPTTPVRSTFGLSKIPMRTPPSADSFRKGSQRTSPSTPTRPRATRKVMPLLKPVEPLRVVKKIGVKNASATTARGVSPFLQFQSQHQQTPLRHSSNLPP